ncbi:MAG: hypothetical protein GEU94_12905 [Micromonosporaceae bacterium]|nr:hypothetical protein [Micromonosporaceae bacterium]
MSTLQIAIIGAGLIVVGTVVTLLGGYQLGLARAASKWESEGSPRIGRGGATAAVLFGLLLIAGGAALLTLLIQLPNPAAGSRAGVAVGAAAVALLAAMFGAAKFADRVELNALIRTPSRFRKLPAGTDADVGGPDGAVPDAASDSVVPPTARPGWVYRDAGGAWYLVVSAGAGYRLVSLPDFKLAPVGLVKPPVTATGSVELAVWPLSEAPGAQAEEARSTST